MIQIIDNYLPDPDRRRSQALFGKFETHNQGGAEFHGIQPSYSADWDRLRSLATGREFRLSKPGTEFFRLYTSDMEHPTFIHEDSAMARWTGLLYLNKDPQGGTAFWEKLGENYVQTAWVESKWNRLLLFDSHLLHSRYPENVTSGLTPETGRLLQVFFFDTQTNLGYSCI